MISTSTVSHQRIVASQLMKMFLTAFALLFLFGSCMAYASEENTKNYLLIGSDRRDSSWNGNSDSMILVTVNYDTEKIYLTSFMRDLYADVPGEGVHKLNYAYAVGGASKLQETLEDNYDVKIDNYIAVDFPTMSQIVDLLGGVYLYIDADEAEYINSQAAWMRSTYDLEQTAADLDGAGYYQLDGPQTVSYARIRFIGNNDYQRTERQRTVLDALRVTVNSLSLIDMEALILKMLDMTDNDISALDSVELLALTQKVKNYELVENRVPYDGMFTTQNEILVPTSMSETIAKLRSVIYADAGSETEISAYSYGQDSSQIKAVQQALNDAGYNCGNVDGIWGGKTASAITDYQKDHKLDETGMIDASLLESLGIKTE